MECKAAARRSSTPAPGRVPDELICRADFQAHIHNEFVSGSRELATRMGARIVASADAGLDFDHQRVRDGGAYFTEPRRPAAPPDTVIACTTLVGDSSTRGQPQ
jgi:hypothetical protein